MMQSYATAFLKLGKNPSDYDVDLLKLAQNFHKNHTLFAVALSAAAQHMIHAAPSLYTENAETVVNIKARNDTLSAVVAIDMAERPYDSRQMTKEGETTTHRMPSRFQTDPLGQTPHCSRTILCHS